MVMADAPIVTMFYENVLYWLKPVVKGLKTTGMDGQIAGDMFFRGLHRSINTPLLSVSGEEDGRDCC
jgi:hypothetical protein